MGLFGSGKGKHEALEAKADGLLGADPLEARRLYREALRKLGGKDAPAVERLRAKAREARARFLESKLAEAERFLEDRICDAAGESLAIARENLEPGEDEWTARVAALEARIREVEQTATVARPIRAGEGLPVVVPPEALAADDDGAEAYEVEDPLAAFEMYAGMLGPDYEHATALSDEFKIGFVAFQLGDRAAALQAFQSECARHPEDGFLHEVLAQALDQDGREEEAAAHFRRAVEIQPERSNARLALAQLMAGPRGGDAPGGEEGTAAALELLADGERLDPGHTLLFRIAKSEILVARRRGAEALATLDPLLQSAYEKEPVLWQLYGAALETQGSLDDAETAYRKFVRLSGQAMAPRAAFAEFALRHGRALDEAEKIIFETCLGCQATRPDEEQLDRYGVILTRIQMARGEYRAALDGAERLLAKGAPSDLVAGLEALRRAARAALSGREEPAES